MDETIFHKIPKIELHCHLEGALRPSTIAELGKQYNLPIPTYDSDEIKRYVELGNNIKSLADWMPMFDMLRRCFVSREIIARITYEVAEDYAIQNTSYLEIRFSPAYMAKLNGITIDEAIEGVIDGMTEAERRLGIKMAAIVIITRHLDSESGEKIATCASRYAERGIVGFDLAGKEKGNPPAPYESAFNIAREAGLGITVHSGEECGPESIKGAIDKLGAQRIGHGLSLGEDTELAEIVKKKDIVLEMCPTSNLKTGNVKSIDQHPLYQYFKEGMKVTINADDPSICATNLQEEYELAVNHLGFSLEELGSTILTAAKAAFLSRAEKDSLLLDVEEELLELGVIS